MPPTFLESVFDTGKPYAAWIEASGEPVDVDAALKTAREALENAEALYKKLRSEADADEAAKAEKQKELAEVQAIDLEMKKQMAEADALYISQGNRLEQLSKGLILPVSPTEVQDLKNSMGKLEGGYTDWQKKYRAVQKGVKDLTNDIAALQAGIDARQQDLKLIDATYKPLEARYKLLYERWHPVGLSGTGIKLPLQVSPTGVNSHAALPRYFRVIGWNLENFTRDPRPRGSAPVHSPRNKARVAVVAYLAHQLGADAVLMMETGTDVGPATSTLAATLHELETRNLKEPKTWHPLTSPATHAIPVVKKDYLEVSVGKPTGEKVLALRVLHEAYNINPHHSALEKARGPDSHVTKEQMGDACRILIQSSPYVKSCDGLPFNYEIGLEAGSWFTLPNGNDCPGPGWFYTLFGATSNFEKPWWDLMNIGNELKISGGFSDKVLQEFERQVLVLRDQIDLGKRGFEGGEFIGVRECLELTFLFILKAHGRMTVDDWRREIWTSHYPGIPYLPLLALYCTSAQPLNLEGIDRDVGPLASAYDPEVLLNALRRVGRVEYNLETYGIAYRPWNSEAMTEALKIRVPGEGPFDAGGIYGILRRDSGDEELAIQTQGNVLAGRSALHILLPAFPHFVPFMLLHNRFTGTAGIKAMESPRPGLKFTQDDNVLRARILTLLEVAAAAAGAKPSPPLILGDFNFPEEVIEPEAEPAKKASLDPWRRREHLRRELSFGMEMHGYLRRVKAAPQSKTSLASYASIASGQNVFSQPYDAVYQPFDFMGGAMKVQSGVVASIDAFFPDAIMKVNIRVTADATAGKDVDLQAVDDDDEAKPEGKTTTNVADSGNKAEPLKDMVLSHAIAGEIRRVYRSLCRQAPAAIVSCRDWIRRELNSAHDEATTKALLALNEDAELTNAIQKRSDDFFDAIKDNIRAVVNIVSDPLDVWIGYADAALAGARSTPPSQMKALPGRLREIKLQLANVETNATIRLWIAYRAVVSDHLPVIVELDMQPT